MRPVLRPYYVGTRGRTYGDARTSHPSLRVICRVRPKCGPRGTHLPDRPSNLLRAAVVSGFSFPNFALVGLCSSASHIVSSSLRPASMQAATNQKDCAPG